MKDGLRGTRLLMLVAIGGVMTLSACRPSSEDVNEVRELQKQILAKLDQLQDTIQRAGETIGAQMERRQQPSGPDAATGTARRRQPSGPDPGTAYELPVGNSPVKGPENAPVTVTEFADYQDPYCARNEPIIADFMKAYPGKVRVVFKHFPLVSIHQYAMPAAKAAVAAQKQGKFWEMQEKLFANQDTLGEQQITQCAQEIGLDMAKFEADMKSPEVQKQVQDDIDLANKVAISSVPTVFVNGKALADRSVNSFRLMVDPILKEKG
jgi:protein-disulfide isomerase